MDKVIIIGAGLADSEAAWQAAQRGITVELYEMRPEKSTPAHKTAGFAELVCSNSLRGAGLENAVGVLKEEMRRLGSIIMEAADATRATSRRSNGRGGCWIRRAPRTAKATSSTMCGAICSPTASTCSRRAAT